MTIRTIFLAVVALGAPVAGCGGGDDQRAIRDVLSRLDDARTNGDAEEACGELVVVQEPDAAARGEKPKADEEEKGGGDADRAECERAFRQVAASARGLRDARQTVLGVQIHGDQATARTRVTVVRGDGSRLDRTVSYRLARGEEGWRVVVVPVE